jgi:F-type H+-transporting ATPase subunit gamma
MPTLKQVRRRLTSVKNTQKITRAMKLVAAAKLRRAQDNMLRTQPYATRIRQVIWDLSEHTNRDVHPLLQVREEKKALMLVITSDRGMCGAFNSNINRRAERYVHSLEGGQEELELALLGRKGRDYFRRRKVSVFKEYMEVLSNPTFERIAEIGAEITARFIDGGHDAVYVVYNEFKSAISQQVVVERLLPIVPERACPERAERAEGGRGGRSGPGRRRSAGRHRVRLRAVPGRDPVVDAAAVRERAAVLRRAGIPGGRNGRPHDGDGVGDQERGRADRPPDTAVQQGPAVGDHHGNAGDRRRRRGVEMSLEAGRPALPFAEDERDGIG